MCLNLPGVSGCDLVAVVENVSKKWKLLSKFFLIKKSPPQRGLLPMFFCRVETLPVRFFSQRSGSIHFCSLRMKIVSNTQGVLSQGDFPQGVPYLDQLCYLAASTIAHCAACNILVIAMFSLGRVVSTDIRLAVVPCFDFSEL